VTKEGFAMANIADDISEMPMLRHWIVGSLTHARSPGARTEWTIQFEAVELESSRLGAVSADAQQISS